MTSRVTANLDDETAARISEEAGRLGQSQSWVIQEALRAYFGGRSYQPPTMPVGTVGFLYEITARFTLPPHDTADQAAHAFSDRLPWWLRQQGAADAYVTTVDGIRSLEARRPVADSWPDPTDPADALREANHLERAQASMASGGPGRPLEESLADIDARRAARREQAEG